MATRSRIGLLVGDESVVSVYHHYDGYPQWLGVFLRKNYTTKEQIEELLDGGDISCIDSDKDWDRNEVESHVQYYNDRGEDTEPRFDSTVTDYLDNGEEYAYLFENNEWVCYDLHYNEPQIVKIPENHPTELAA